MSKNYQNEDWLHEGGGSQNPSDKGRGVPPEKYREVERVLEALEKKRLDITADYNDWLRIGFAFVSSFGEEGRDFFHRVSRFYPGYDRHDCDKQYTYCLKSRGSGVHLATFFRYAREAGIDIRPIYPEIDPDFTADHSPFFFQESLPEEFTAQNSVSLARAQAEAARKAAEEARELELEQVRRDHAEWLQRRRAVSLAREQRQLEAAAQEAAPESQQEPAPLDAQASGGTGMLPEGENPALEAGTSGEDFAAADSLKIAPEAEGMSPEADLYSKEDIFSKEAELIDQLYSEHPDSEEWYFEEDPESESEPFSGKSEDREDASTEEEDAKAEAPAGDRDSEEENFAGDPRSGEKSFAGAFDSAPEFSEEEKPSSGAAASEEDSGEEAGAEEEDPATKPSEEEAFSGEVISAEEIPGEEVSSEERTEAKMPVFPRRLYENLPEFLKRAVAPGESDAERDLLLLGCLGAASACFPKLKGLYDSKEYRPNLYLFVTAQASAGKGKLAHCKQLVAPLHWKLREQAEVLKQEYELELAEYNSAQGEKSGRRKPQKPAERMLFLPANNSATGMFQLLADNQGQGLIFESEGDTLTQSLRTEISDYSDGFRKAFHHETISYYRRTDREYVSIETPCLSTVISGTPKQVVSLIRNVEDGLFSRFMFYYLNARPEFKEVFAPNPHGNLDLYYREMGKELLALHERLLQQEDLWVQLSEPQIQRFYTFFRRILAKYRNLKQEEYTGTINRLGVVAFRLCMLFTVFRTLEDGQLESPRTCSDLDFEGVLSMIGVLVRHSSRMFNLLPEETQLKKKNNPKELFFEQLPAEFSRGFYLELAERMHIKPKTAENYIKQFVKDKLLQHPEYGRYINLSLLNDAAGGGTGKELGAA